MINDINGILSGLNVQQGSGKVEGLKTKEVRKILGCSVFTAAHELGHALLHEQLVLHRDRAIDGAKNAPFVGEEAQAEKFAALFLMPTRSVRKVFKRVFERSVLELSEGTALLL